MKILLVTPRLPWPLFSGGQIRVFETLRHLSRNHSVTLLTTVRSEKELVHASAIRDICDRVEVSVSSDRTWPRLRQLSRRLARQPVIQSVHHDEVLAARLRRHTAEESYDILQIEHSYLAHYLSAVSPSSRARRVLSMHNVETIRFERELQVSPWSARRLALLWDRIFFKSWEDKAIRAFDGVAVVSELEQSWIHAHDPRATVEVVPNGVDSTYFRASRAAKTSPSIVFTGAMDYPPNIDGAVWFCDKVLPLLQARVPDILFKVVGRQPDRRVLELGQRRGVHVTGQVADIRPYVTDSSVFVVPLRSGGGTRLKILEAMALGCPVVSTEVGAEGLEVTPDEDILLADNPEQFVDRVLQLLESPTLANSIGKAGRRLVAENYDWQACLSKLDSLYDKVRASEN